MNRTVIRVPNHLGDSIMAKGAIESFVELCPDSDVSLLLARWTVPIYKDLDYVKLLCVESDKLHGVGAIVHQTKILKKNRFDTGVVLTPSFSSALILYLSGIKNRYGYDGEGRGFLLNNKISSEGLEELHRSIQYLKLLEHAAGYNLNEERPFIKISEEGVGLATALLKEGGIDPGTEFMAIAPQAVAESRRWGSANYAELARKMDMPVALVGTADEFAAGQEIARDNKNVINLCGKTDIESAAAVLSMARLFVGNDSGLAHLAAAVETPLVVLSGADRPAETSPISDQKTVIIKDQLECISCVKNECRLKGEAFMQCMKQITVEEVYKAAKKILTKS